MWKKIRLNWKLKISNMADNVDINRHRYVTLVNVDCRN